MFSKEIKHIAINVAIFTIFIHCHLLLCASGQALIPADEDQLVSWFHANVKPFAERKGTLDPELAEAEAKPRIIKVRKDGSGEYKTITDAIKSIPSGNTERIIVWIGPGVYQEKIKIERDKKFVTLYGSPNAMPNVTYGGTAAQFGTFDSATIIAESDYFMACNLNIVNSAPRPDTSKVGGQAVAMRITGDKAAFYNCRMIGFQDTLCDDKGNHFFKGCHIEGTVDFIFGSGKSLYLSSTINALGDDDPTVITAHARDNKSHDSGFAFVHCKIIGTGNETYLGRHWKGNAQVVYAYTNMGRVIHPTGWSNSFHPGGDEDDVFYGEYKCSGPGAAKDKRFKFTKQLTDEEAKPYLHLGFVHGDKWLLPPPKI